jgi:hypothetical protein
MHQPAAESGREPQDDPWETVSLVGHTAFGVALIIALAVWSPIAAMIAYVVMAGVARLLDMATMRPRLTTWPERVGWAAMLPFLALGLSVRLLFEALGSIFP